MYLELAENGSTVGNVAGSIGGSTATGAAIGTAVLPGIGTAIGAAVGAAISIFGGSNTPPPPRGFIDPESPDYDLEIASLYEAGAVCRSFGGTLSRLSPGSPLRCMVIDENGVAVDKFAALAFRVARIYYIGEPTQYYEGGQSGSPRPGASGYTYPASQARVDLEAPNGAIITITGNQFDRIPASAKFYNGGFQYVRSDAVPGYSVNAETGAPSKNLPIVPLAIVSGLLFFT